MLSPMPKSTSKFIPVRQFSHPLCFNVSVMAKSIQFNLYSMTTTRNLGGYVMAAVALKTLQTVTFVRCITGTCNRLNMQADIHRACGGSCERSCLDHVFACDMPKPLCFHGSL